jgi:hypothetical protein
MVAHITAAHGWISAAMASPTTEQARLHLT